MNITNIGTKTEAELIAEVKDVPEYIQYISNPSEAVQLAVVEQRPSFIGYIQTPTEKVCNLARELANSTATELAGTITVRGELPTTRIQWRKAIASAVKNLNEFNQREKTAERLDVSMSDVKTLAEVTMHWLMSNHTTVGIAYVHHEILMGRGEFAAQGSKIILNRGAELVRAKCPELDNWEEEFPKILRR
jgi:hypothetical protein